MSTTLRTESRPAWEIASLFPDQGQWGEGDYLTVSRGTNRLVEFDDGHVEVLALPTKTHQRIVLYLYNALLMFVGPGKLGEILVAPYPVRLREGKFREPDIIFMLSAHRERMREEYAEGADLVFEVVSDENRSHDLVTKRREYAEAGIPEYWIIDQRERKIIVLSLRGAQYEECAEYAVGQQAASVVLPGFTVDIEAVFAVAAEAM